MASKRKVLSSSKHASTRRTKKSKSSASPEPTKPQISLEDNGVILRNLYGPEMSNDRAIAYKTGELPRPIELLEGALKKTASSRGEIHVRDAVVHWFRADLRTQDNRALSLASERAREGNVPLITMYLISTQDLEAHLTSPARVDFILRSLQMLKDDLAKLDIPLYVETVDERKKTSQRIKELLDGWGANHVFANMEFEVDELRRDEGLVRALLEKGVAFDVLPDNCIVHPGELVSGAGNQYLVFTPWFRHWVSHIHEKPELLKASGKPARNPAGAREEYAKLFESRIPEAPKNKTLTGKEKTRFHSLWLPGEREAQESLKNFIDQRIGDYEAHRNFPAKEATSFLSVHLASGTLSARTAVRTAQEHSHATKLDDGNAGIQAWIREVAWRDFYRHVLAHWPHICMYKPFKLDAVFIRWEYGQENFNAWCEGRTGYPIVDAAMRQLKHHGWIHNRCRMIVASFFSKHLLIDWRMGEKYFMEHLIDGDFASNNGGWGFSTSTGVDCQPYFRVFNPLLQSERFDPEGEYIRRWIPELSKIEGKAIHDPYDRGEGAVAEQRGYPRRIVEHKESRERCLARYKEGLGRVNEP